jgi:hypothetical protein
MVRIYHTVMARYKLKGHEYIKRLIAIGTYDYNICSKLEIVPKLERVVLIMF